MILRHSVAVAGRNGGGMQEAGAGLIEAKFDSGSQRGVATVAPTLGVLPKRSPKVRRDK